MVKGVKGGGMGLAAQAVSLAEGAENLAGLLKFCFAERRPKEAHTRRGRGRGVSGG
jgi:hypothetical protein